MLILIAPLNWGLGHATRCIPLVRRFLSEGHRVVLGGKGESLNLLRRHFPKLSFVELAPLNLTYSSGNSQVGAMLRALPQIIISSIRDHRLLRQYQKQYHFDIIVSDNRFGLYTTRTRSVYITHQLYIRLPRPWRWLEPLAHRLHRAVYKHYDEVWVPDFEEREKSLAAELSHGPEGMENGSPKGMEKGKWKMENCTVRYIGPLSRFEGMKKYSEDKEQADKQRAEEERFRAETVAILSGLEPQRTLFERELIERFSSSEQQNSVLIVEGRTMRPKTIVRHGHITIVPHLTDREMRGALLHASHIIARSGYSTIMDLYVLGVAHRAELIPTPGQSEQHYLAHAIGEVTCPYHDGNIS